MNDALIALHIAGRFVLTCLMTFGLVYFADVLSKGERLGMGMIGGSSFLTIAIIADTRKIGTPFDVWSPSILTYGVIVFCASRIWRFHKHRRANERMKEASARYYEEKGA